MKATKPLCGRTETTMANKPKRAEKAKSADWHLGIACAALREATRAIRLADTSITVAKFLTRAPSGAVTKAKK